MKRMCILIGLLALLSPVHGQVADLRLDGAVLSVSSRADVLSAIRTLAPEATRDMTIVVDGFRVSPDLLETLSVHDIREVRVLRDAVSLARWGLHGGKGVIEIKTRTSETDTTATGVTYLAEGAMERAAAETTLPQQTGWAHRHRLNVTGVDPAASYLLTARLSPNSQGVLKGSGQSALGLRSYVAYRHKALSLHNDLTFDHQSDDLSSYVRYARDNSSGSEDRLKTSTLTDRFGGELTLMRQLHLTADFAFTRQSARRNTFLSPRSDWFDTSGDMRLQGSYHTGRSRSTTYDGGLALHLSDTLRRGRLNASAGIRLYDECLRGENYGGRGLLSDRMNYISFTLAYDTAQAPTAHRDYERTLQGWAALDYELADRYGLELSGNWNRSSLLSPRHRQALYYGARLYWHLHHEPWFHAPAIESLTLSLNSGSAGLVAFTYRDYTAMYRNDTQQQYIYNYYLLGATLQNLPNADIRPATLTTHSLTASLATATLGLTADLHLRRLSHLPNLQEQPLSTGFTWQTGSSGKLDSRGIDLTANLSLNRSEDLWLDGLATMSYENSDEDDMLRGSLGLMGGRHRWSAGLTIGGDRHWGQSSLQLGYRLPFGQRALRRTLLALTAENLVSWHASSLLAQLSDPPVRRYTLSLQIDI